jgi:Zn-dependent M28 family amino/carboxypeptidase
MRLILVFTFIISHLFSSAQADTNILLSHLKTLVETHGSRYYKDTSTLNNAADYIKTEFKKYSISVSEQVYEVKGRKYKNIICSFDTSHAERIVIGAHYDVCDPLPGADDNATGVAGLLELARMMSDSSFKSNCRIDLVAYTLEEPPFFRTENMGSYVHAKSLHDKGIKVRGMISLEMIGYFSDEKKSQEYPLGIFKLIYGRKGNFITVVQKTGGGKFVRKFKRKMKRNSPVETKGFKAPAWVTGVDFSDHLNYWKFDIPAMMITDTSFFRNKNYHTSEDTIEKLDLERMAQVVDGVFITLNKMIQ